MQTGIIGLPHVGKTSLFKILTRAHIDAKAAHAATHVGVAKVPDSRLDRLAALFKPKKTTHAAIEYVDVGGLVKDRTKDSALFNELRQVDALAHVVRLFENPSVPHSSGDINALRDVESVELELILNDLDQISRRLERLEKDLKKKADPLLEREQALLTRCRIALESETPLRQMEFTIEEKKTLTSFMFLSARPMLFVVNVSDSEASEIDAVVEKHGLQKLAEKPGTGVVGICGRIEAELSELNDAEAAELMSAYGLRESGLARLIQATYRLLGLISFFTVGEIECRAWTIPQATSAVKAAGAIHSDIERGFIKAEVMRWDEMLAAGSIAALRDIGKLKLEGKDYIVQDGDIVHFRHSG